MKTFLRIALLIVMSSSYGAYAQLNHSHLNTTDKIVITHGSIKTTKYTAHIMMFDDELHIEHKDGYEIYKACMVRTTDDITVYTCEDMEIMVYSTKIEIVFGNTGERIVYLH